MEREINKHCTVIKVKKPEERVPGVSRWNKGRFRAEIYYQKKKYAVGIFDTYQEAAAARKLAEKKAAAGILPQWLATRPHGLTPENKKFWDSELNGKEYRRMKTANDVIEFMEAEYLKSMKEREAAVGIDHEKALTYLIKATVIQELLEEIKG